jgi:SAM-dependent methyltransferase
MKEFWDDRFSISDYVYGTKPNEFFINQLLKLTPGKILIPADGEGRNGVAAAKAGWDVSSVDFSDTAREKALRLAKENSVKLDYKISDLSQYNFPEDEFDAAALIHVHFPGEIRTEIHRKIVNSLKPGGIFFFQLFSKKQIENNSGGPKNIDLLYSLEQLNYDFEGYNIISLNERDITLDEGAFHKGQAAVIEGIIRK